MDVPTKNRPPHKNLYYYFTTNAHKKPKKNEQIFGKVFDKLYIEKGRNKYFLPLLTLFFKYI
ncbi:hypothetical protein DN409_26130 [Bacillus mycoides]|nr:hypothetical protein DN409_26130 [Bacillus mycoides]